jgi:hypothetical protein
MNINKSIIISSPEWRQLSNADRIAIMEERFGRNSVKAALYRRKWTITN